VSISKSGSPFSTVSPGDLSHFVIVRLPCPDPARELDLVGHGYFPTVRLIAREHVFGVRDDVLLHHRRERERRELRSDALDRRVEVVESLVLQHRRDLGAEPHRVTASCATTARFVFFHGRDDRVLVERPASARVDHLDGDALFLGLLRCIERAMHGGRSRSPSRRCLRDRRAPCRAGSLDLLRHFALHG